MICEIVEKDGVTYLKTPMEPDVWALYDLLEDSGFESQVVCFDGFDNALRII